MDRGSSVLRGAIALLVLGVLAAVTLMSPVGAALNKSKVKKIVKKLAYTEAEADSRFLQSEGLTRIAVGPHNWVGQPGHPTLEVSYSFNVVSVVTGGGHENQSVSVSPDIPIALYGRAVQLRGVEFCFEPVGGPPTKLDDVYLTVWSNTTTAAAATIAVQHTDPADGTSGECRLYSLPTPFTLTEDHFVTFNAQIDFGTGGGQFDIGRTTFILGQTTSPA